MVAVGPFAEASPGSQCGKPTTVARSASGGILRVPPHHSGNGPFSLQGPASSFSFQTAMADCRSKSMPFLASVEQLSLRPPYVRKHNGERKNLPTLSNARKMPQVPPMSAPLVPPTPSTCGMVEDAKNKEAWQRSHSDVAQPARAETATETTTTTRRPPPAAEVDAGEGAITTLTPPLRHYLRERAGSPGEVPTRRFAAPGWFEQKLRVGTRGIFAAETSVTTRNLLPSLPLVCRSTTAPSHAPSATALDGERLQRGRVPRLSASENVKLTLTFRPDVSTAISLDEAVDEAKREFDPHNEIGVSNHEGPNPRSPPPPLPPAASSAALRGSSVRSHAVQAMLIAAAEAKQLENRREFERCANARAERQAAFMRCDPIATVLLRLYRAVSTTSKTSGGYVSAPRRMDFLDVHRTLLREGFLDESAVGEEASAFPYCYAPPAWSESEFAGPRAGATGDATGGATGGASAGDNTGVEVAASAGMTRDADVQGAAPELSGGGEAIRAEYTAEHASKSAEELSLIACWDVGLLAWRLLQARGGVKRFAHTLTFDAFRGVIFDLADAHLTHAQRNSLAPTRSGDVATRLQAYFEVACRLVNACLVPVAELGGSGGSGGGSGGVSSDNLPGVHEPGTRSLTMPPPAAERARHAWPAYDAHFTETVRKHALLRAGVREHQGGTLSAESAAREFRTICRVVFAFGKGARRKGAKISYSQMLTALRARPGHNYADLVFRQTVVGRESKGTAAEVLAGATMADAEQMVCYLRWLDRDCDGYISEADFSAVCVLRAEVDSAADLAKRWRAAAVKMDKPSLKGGVRGVLDKIGGA